MSIPPKSIQPGRCYLFQGERGLRLRRVIQILPNGRLQVEDRVGSTNPSWRPRVMNLRSFQASVIREVPCDWTPEMDEA
jgi:hypothetical protein